MEKNENVKNKNKPLKRKKRPLGTALRQDGPLYLMALPGLAALILFSYLPMTGIILVFKDYNFRGGMYGSPWADPIYKNFQFFFNNISTAARATGLTVMYNILFFVVGTIVSVAIAIMLSEISSKRFIKISQSMMFLPYFISWMVMGAIIFALLNMETGLFHQFFAGLFGEKFDFYSRPNAWPFLLVILNTWQSCGYNSIIYYGVLTGIDSSLYEAARVDGATRWQCIRKITLPLIKPTVVILFLLSIGGMLRGNLNMIIGLTNLNPLLLPMTDLIDVFVYRSGVRNGEMAFASAVSLYQSIFGFILVVTANKIAGKFDSESTLF